MERDLGWSGLLAEGDPSNVERVKYEKIEMKTQHYMVTGANQFKLLFCRSKNRKSLLLPHCLSLSRQTMHVTFRQAFNVGKVMISDDIDIRDKKDWHSFVDVTCVPLFGVLKALNVTKVDYFSLDVEGAEMDVLRTIPFDDLDITVEFCLLQNKCFFKSTAISGIICGIPSHRRRLCWRR